ncbi:unnamed protein product [Ectocarpus sp. CCAP 1310/34]|nr:unnamed protein product [Ectocarpus sp. CCAP 1310/34]
MLFRRLLFPAAATLARAVEVRSFTSTSGAAGAVQHLSVSPRRQQLGAFLHGSEPLSRSSTGRTVSKVSRGMATGEKAGSGEILNLKTAQDVVDFWFGTDLVRLASDREYGQSFGAKWFGVGPPDQAFIGTQNASKELMAKAGSGELKGEEWETPKGALARLLLLDQFPRTVYRGTSQAFAHDETAASLSLEIISKGWDTVDARNYTFQQRLFVYLPLMHSERIEAQDACVSKVKALVDDEMKATGSADSLVHDMALEHRGVVAKFGRFPHRNAALRRESTPEELQWLSSDDIPGWAKSQGASEPSSPS